VQKSGIKESEQTVQLAQEQDWSGQLCRMRSTVEIRVQNKECVRLVLPADLGPECLQKEWNVTIHPQETRVLAFWDTFEWGLWFGGHALYSCGNIFHLCTRDEGWLGAVLCEEESLSGRRFWWDFETVSMRTALEEMLGLRGLAPVVEGTFRLRRSEVLNEMGKIVCRLEWSSISAGKVGDEELLHSCLVMPLLGYETEAARVMEFLSSRGAKTSGDGPVEVLLQHANRVPQVYTLRPAFGLGAETPAREAVGQIVRTILGIAIRNVPGIMDDLDTEFLHDYRICLRKIRSMLSLVKDVYPPDGTRRMRQILGDLARQTNRLRDLDVYLLARSEYLGLLPPDLRPPLEGMFDDFSAEREREVRRTISKMRGQSNRRCLRKLEDYFSEGTSHKPSSAADLPVGPLVFRCIYKRYRKIRKIAAEIGAETPDELVHQLRIECKKLRYLMEFFSELIPGEEGAAMLKMLRRLQGRLGEFNDASVQQKALLDYWEQNKSGADVALGLGGLVSVLYHRQQQTRGLIEEALEMFCSGSTAAAFKRAFKFPEPAPAANSPRNTQR
jgi:CHAD domain-containing protein